MRDYYNPIKSFCLKWDLPPFWDSNITQANMIREIIKALNAMLNENNEFVNTVNGKILDMQKIIDDFIEMFDVDLANTIEEKLEEWEISGKLEEIINKALFDLKLDKSEFYSYQTDIETTGNKIVDGVAERLLNEDNNILNVLSFNIYVGGQGVNNFDLLRFTEFKKYIQNVMVSNAVSICGMQEVWEMTNLINDLSKPYYKDYFFAKCSDDERTNRAYGNCMTSSLEFLSSNYKIYDYRSESVGERRNYQHVVIKLNDTYISCYNTHLDHITPLPQLEELKNVIINDMHNHIVVTGDFNMDVGSENFKNFLLETGLKSSNKGEINTFPNPNPTGKIDDVLYKGFNELERKIINVDSDHYAYNSRLEII